MKSSAKRPSALPLPRGHSIFLAKLRRKSARTHRLESAAPGSYFRFQDCGAEKHRFETFARKYAERFDELVVGEFLHVERCDNRSFYGSIGGLTLWWTVERNGDVVITHAELRGAKFGPGALDYVMPQFDALKSRRGRGRR